MASTNARRQLPARPVHVVKRVLASLWVAVTDPLVWRLAIGVPLVASCLALAYVPGLVADEEPTTLRVTQAEIPAVDTP
jgi:hypothetical protein